MKLLFPILAIYLLMVFLMPCADMHGNETLKNHNHLNEITNIDNTDHFDQTNSVDLCSPFCLCNCCGRISGFVFEWKTITFPIIKTDKLPETLPQYIPQFIPRYCDKIWQPPKINA